MRLDTCPFDVAVCNASIDVPVRSSDSSPATDKLDAVSKPISNSGPLNDGIFGGRPEPNALVPGTLKMSTDYADVIGVLSQHTIGAPRIIDPARIVQDVVNPHIDDLRVPAVLEVYSSQMLIFVGLPFAVTLDRQSLIVIPVSASPVCVLLATTAPTLLLDTVDTTGVIDASSASLRVVDHPDPINVHLEGTRTPSDNMNVPSVRSTYSTPLRQGIECGLDFDLVVYPVANIVR